mgnify:CR=1 FL=1
MKIKRLDVPFIPVTQLDMAKAQFNRLAYFIEQNPQQGDITWINLDNISFHLKEIAKEGRKLKERDKNE